MNRMSKTLLLSLATLLAACGGSDDGGGAPGVPLAALTSANSPVIASVVVGAVSDSLYVGDLSGLAAPTSAATGGVSVGDVDVGAPPVLAVSIGSDVEQCAVSGTVSFTATIANPETLTPGDSISLTFDDCDQGDGVLLDGGFGFSVATFQGDVATGAFRFAITVTLSDLRLIENGESTTLAGDMSLTIDTMNASAMSLTVAGNSLTVTSGNESASLAGYSIALTVDPLVGTSLLEVDGTVQSSEFAGRVDVATTAPLVVNVAGIPTEGEITIDGANGATITVRVVSAELVELHVDLDGNGTVDEVIATTWGDLGG